MFLSNISVRVADFCIDFVVVIFFFFMSLASKTSHSHRQIFVSTNRRKNLNMEMNDLLLIINLWCNRKDFTIGSNNKHPLHKSYFAVLRVKAYLLLWHAITPLFFIRLQRAETFQFQASLADMLEKGFQIQILLMFHHHHHHRVGLFGWKIVFNRTWTTHWMQKRKIILADDGRNKALSKKSPACLWCPSFTILVNDLIHNFSLRNET